MDIFYTSYNSSLLGKLFIATTQKGICALTLEENFCKKFSRDTVRYVPTLISKSLIAKLDEYFSGVAVKFSEPLDLIGITPFQRMIFDTVRTIPYGNTISYKELALRIKNPNASRACGQALGKNPVMIIIPCHRVIGSNGDLRGFSSGIEIKRKLLKLERAI